MAFGNPIPIGTPVAFDGAASTTKDFALGNPTAGRVLNFAVAARRSTTGAPAANITVAISGGATWSFERQQAQNTQSNRHTLAAFRGIVPASPGTALTATFTSDQGINRWEIAAWEEDAADVTYYGTVTGESASATPSVTLAAAPATADYKMGVIASVGDSSGVDPGDTAAMTELHDSNPTALTATTLQIQYRTGVTTTGIDWKNCATTSNLMVGWIVKESVAASMDLVGRAVVSVGDTNYAVESAALTPGRHVFEVRRSQAGNVIGLRVDGGTEATTATTGTHNAQTGPRVVGARIVNGAAQNDAVTVPVAYVASYPAIPTGGALTAARAAAAQVLAPLVVQPIGLAVSPSGTTNLPLSAWVTDRSGAGWEVGAVSAEGASAAIGSDGQSVDISSVAVSEGETVNVTVRVDNLMPSAVRASTSIGFACAVGQAAFTNGYSYRRRWIIPADRVSGSGSFTGFVARLEVEASWARSVANGGELLYSAGFADVRIETEGGTQLPCWVLRADPQQGILVIEWRIASLSGSADNRGYLYYGRDQSFSSNDDQTYQDYLAAIDTSTGFDLSPSGHHFDSVGVTPAFLLDAPAGQAAGGGALRQENVSWLTGPSSIAVEGLFQADATMVGTNKGLLAQGPLDGQDQNHNIVLRHAQTGFRGGASQPLIWSVNTSGGTARLESSANAQTTTVRHFLAAWESAALPRLWLNGALNAPSWVGKIVAGTPTQNSAITGTLLAATGLATIFASAWDAVAGGWSGLIGQLRFRAHSPSNDYALTLAEMLLDNEAFIGLGGRDASGDATAAPVAAPVTTTVASGGQVDVDVLAKAYDPDGTLAIVGLDGATTPHGSAAIVAGKVRYTPNIGYGGQDRVGYTITDGTKTAHGVIRVDVTGGSPLPTAYQFDYGLPWPLPVNNDNIVFFNFPVNGNANLPAGDNWNKILVVVAPAGKAVKSFANVDNLKWGGIILVGFEWAREGQSFVAGPSDNPIAQVQGGHIFSLKFQAGASAAMPAGRRPYVWLSNHFYDTNGNKSIWGDYIRHGTTIVGAATNKNDYHDFFWQNMHFARGHNCFDSTTTGQETNPHSDLLQSALGGANNIIVCRSRLIWNGLCLYTLDSGNINNKPDKTKSPEGSFFALENTTLIPQADPLNVDNGAWRYHTQSRDGGVWSMADGQWRQFRPKNAKFWLPAGHPRFAAPDGAFATPNYPAPTTVNEGGKRWVRWAPAFHKGRWTVEGDRQIEIVANQGDLPIVVDPANTGSAWRITGHDALRQIFA